MQDTIEATYSEFLAKTTLIRRWLMLAGDEERRGFSTELAANVRAWSLVWTCAAVENFWVPFLKGACEHFSQSSAFDQRRKIKAQSIFFLDKMFQEVTRELTPRWERSFALLEDFVKADRKGYPVKIPYDGKTVRPSHVELYWKLFELSGDPFPSMIHRQSLETLANDRNEIAHGERSPSTVGRLRTKADVQSTLAKVEETFERTYVSTRNLLKLGPGGL
jgi:hypothetical protein